MVIIIDLDRVLKKEHEIRGNKLEISDTPFKARPVPKKRRRPLEAKAKENVKPSEEKNKETRAVFVSGFSIDTDDETLEMFFESPKRSGGGDIEKFERCQPDVALITFKSDEVAKRVLKKGNLELSGYHLQLREKKMELTPPLEKNVKPSEEKIKETRAVFVSGFSIDTDDETLEMFFESPKRSGGGDIEKFERCQLDVALITFKSDEVAKRVLEKGNLELSGYRLQLREKKMELSPPLEKKTQHGDEEAYLGEVRTVIVSGFSSETTDDVLEMFFESHKRSVASQVLLQKEKMELEGYRLQVKEKQPELFLPLDRKKIYVENLDPKTTEDGLLNYIELRAKTEACAVEFGDHRNAVVSFNDVPDINNVLQNNKKLEGAVLKFSNPPVCNSVLVTGLTKKTTKQTIEMFFENEKNGGVVQNLRSRKHKLNSSSLTLSEYYPFMQTVKETTTKMVNRNSDVMDHVIRNCEEEFRGLFGEEILEIFKKSEEEIELPTEIADTIEKYIVQFAVSDVPLCAKLLENSREELGNMITTVQKNNVTITLEEEKLQIKLTGKKEEVNEIYEQLKYNIIEMEEKLDVATDHIVMHGNKLELLLLHDVENILENDFQTDVKIEPRKGTVTFKGKPKQISQAKQEIYKIATLIEEDNFRLNEIQGHFLQSGGLDMINRGMKGIGLKGMVSLDSKTSKAKILVFDNVNIESIYSYLRSNMYQKQYSLDEDSITLLRSNKWKEFHGTATTNTPVKIYTETSSNEISLIGRKPEVEESYEKVEEFMKRNTIIKYGIELTNGHAGYLAEYCSEDIEEIEKKLEEQSVRIQFVEDEATISLAGTKEGVEKAKNQLNTILSGIANGTMVIDKPRMQEFLESEEGKLFIGGIEYKHKCFIFQTKSGGGQSTVIPSTRPKPAFELLCSYETREKVVMKVYKGDLTIHRCDVIVNAANGDLNHAGGLAGSLLVAGGNEIQEECDAYVKAEGRLYDGECFNGSPGKLPCKRLIHAVAHRWDSSKQDKVCKTLRVTCIRVLEEAKAYRSIALPALGSGIYGIPKDVCADIMIDAAEEYSKTCDNCLLKEIHFVNNDDESGQAFVKKFQAKFGGRTLFKKDQKMGGSRFCPAESIFQNEESDREESEVLAEALPRQRADNFMIKGNMKILVAVGDLSTYKADVLVNTTGESLNLDSNPCSKALSNEAGPILQTECSKIGKLQPGEVAVTKGGNLLCDDVYHVVCVQWSEGQGEQVLRTIIKNCLQKCHSSGKTSIAFPAIGTGILGFPHDVAAKIFFGETKEFGQRVSNCSIKEVSFVVYSQDAKSIEAFTSALKKQSEWDSSGPAAPSPVTVGRKKGKKKRNAKSTVKKNDSPSSSMTNPSEGENSVLYMQVGDDKEIAIVKGDITKEKTDVVAHLTNPSLIMKSGVAMVLARAGGKEIERQCKEKIDSGKPSAGTTVFTTAGQLDVKYVAHMVAPASPTSSDIEKSISSCLKESSEKECESISFPAVGTGSLQQDPEKAAKTIFSSIARFLKSSSGPLKVVRIVLKDDNLVTAFLASVKKFNEDEEPGMLKRLANFFWKSDPSTVNVKEKPTVVAVRLLLEIYAKDEPTVQLVKGRILKVMDSQKKKEKIEDDNIEKLSEQQISEIQDLCDIHDVKVTIEKILNRIVLVGHSDDVSKIYVEIHRIFTRIRDAEKEKEKAALQEDFAEMVSQGVQWFSVDPTSGDHEEYDKHTNAVIEKAYSREEKSVIFLVNDEKFEIVFDQMQETNLVENETKKVIRKDLKAEVTVPEYWEAQPRDANGKETGVHLVCLDPNNPSHKDEYKKISDLFNKTASSHTIVQIERIQNPSLYKLYFIKKRGLDEKKGSNEMILFHGTKGDKLKEINESGLNRNYAGINGTAFGKGVYFARDASMSVGYTQPDSTTSKRYMYVANVAVGEYAAGKSSMLVPPQKSNSMH
ncbi:protein mono-ADP-ribosyltransferase PARP14-like [Dendronephthya gigantea]|uniref:protein mono-ADP-ribosyltransferase PARP14-like n=1 Tax=Dendronephthya gigantea TaxID=151771 RepID=UPI00106BFD95|nr:protein mono-ADP-ribosyltransferase PARP14-like [Dendronephthya gigantea]